MDTATIQRTAVETPRPGLAPAIALRSVAIAGELEECAGRPAAP